MDSSRIDRTFAEGFTRFYCDEVLRGGTDQYNYEKFYDFINEFLHDGRHGDVIANFCEPFRKEYVKDFSLINDNYNLVSRFRKIFNQLIADILSMPRYYEDVTYGNYPKYEAFVSFIASVVKNQVINVHTLNHDLLIDMLGRRHHLLWEHFCDGFSELGSPFFGEVSVKHRSEMGEINKEYKIRLRYFNNLFDKNLQLFKLHGSIDNYTLLLPTEPGGRYFTRENSVMVKKDYAVREFLKERIDEGLGRYLYDHPFAEEHPDYLTGTTEKIRNYSVPYYQNLFLSFEANLRHSNKLFVIGYGFQDDGINNFLIKDYLAHGKHMIVIDIKKPQSPIIAKFSDQIEFINKSVTDVTFDEFTQAL